MIVRAGTRLTLTPEEQQIVELIAKLRTDNNKRAGTHIKYGDGDAYQLDVDGFGAEMAWARMANVYPDFTTQVRKGGVDFKYGMENEYKGDVKGTRMENPHLLIKTEKMNGESDIYVLIKVDYPTFEVIGFATRDQVYDGDTPDYGYGPSYRVRHEDLLTEYDII
jgi:hypothetical protein